jgi:hypothetical protein
MWLGKRDLHLVWLIKDETNTMLNLHILVMHDKKNIRDLSHYQREGPSTNSICGGAVVPLESDDGG